ncbi:MAG TPA: dTDP-glucose 4,6-dehydratase [Burkholderiales bacterium]|nr:dTDP-glucose 4,6-dehydratase [Burkholderiales bacterium]
MRKLLITGGAGFIGANFVHYWRKRHPQDFTLVLDALTYAGNAASLKDAEGKAGFKFVHGDVRDQGLVERLLAEYAIDTIVHFAAESHVDRSIVGPDAFIDTNVVGTHALLKAARNAWAKRDGCRFHHVSTDEVYGSLGPNDAAFTEATPYAPNSPYAASKAASDHLVRAYHHTYKLPVTASNCSNNYGPFHFPEKLIPLMLINVLEGRKLPMYGDGKNVRDWLYVEDHCRGIELVLEKGRLGETYNIGGNNERTNLDIVTQLCRLIDQAFSTNDELRKRFPNCPAAQEKINESLIHYVADRPGHDRRYAIDASRARAELGYTPAETLESGLAKTLAWYLANEDWWRGVMDESYRDWVLRQYST